MLHTFHFPVILQTRKEISSVAEIRPEGIHYVGNTHGSLTDLLHTSLDITCMYTEKVHIAFTRLKLAILKMHSTGNSHNSFLCCLHLTVHNASKTGLTFKWGFKSS